MDEVGLIERTKLPDGSDDCKVVGVVPFNPDDAPKPPPDFPP